MQTIVKYLNWFVRLDGLVLLVLGILFWSGNALNLVPLHTSLGPLLVLALWVIAGFGAVAHVPIGKVVLAFVWGAAVLWIGMTQQTMMPGSSHWVIQVVHLLLGLGAIGMAQMIASAMGLGSKR